MFCWYTWVLVGLIGDILVWRLMVGFELMVIGGSVAIGYVGLLFWFSDLLWFIGLL